MQSRVHCAIWLVRGTLTENLRAEVSASLPAGHHPCCERAGPGTPSQVGRGGHGSRSGLSNPSFTSRLYKWASSRHFLEMKSSDKQPTELASFTEYHVFRSHPRGSMNQQFIPFFCLFPAIIFHCVARPDFVWTSVVSNFFL